MTPSLWGEDVEKMKKDPDEDKQELRARAVAIYNHTRSSASQAEVDLQRLVYELEVHQIELELQNQELIASRAEVEKLLAQYTELYDFAPLGYFTLARDGTILQANLRGAILLLVDRSHLVKRNFERFVADDYKYPFKMFLNKAFEGHGKEEIEIMLLREMKEPFYAELTAQVAEDDTECRVVIMDITERKRLEALRDRGLRDALTGLYNRKYYDDIVANIEQGHQFPISIILMEIDGLKQINNRFGHNAGDNLLKRTAAFLTCAFRTEDILSRVSGDEFTALLLNTDAIEANHILQRVQQSLRENNQSQQEHDIHLTFGLSTAENPTMFLPAVHKADDSINGEKRIHKGLNNPDAADAN